MIQQREELANPEMKLLKNRELSRRDDQPTLELGQMKCVSKLTNQRHVAETGQSQSVRPIWKTTSQGSLEKLFKTMKTSKFFRSQTSIYVSLWYVNCIHDTVLVLGDNHG